jgi:peroxiredoxin Q/BCP
MKAFVLALLAVSALASVAGAAELKVGDMAPDFTLQGSDGKTYKLSEFRGKQAVALAWFPKAFTQGCTIECKSLAENGHLIKKFDAKYFMISIDPLEQNKAFADAQHADFPLLSDPSKQTADAYGVMGDFTKFGLGMLPNRWTFYIGKDGRIAAIDKQVKPASSAEDMAAKFKELGVPAAKGSQD